MTALITEGLSWKDVRLRTMHAGPVKLAPLPPDRQRSSAGVVPRAEQSLTR